MRIRGKTTTRKTVQLLLTATIIYLIFTQYYLRLQNTPQTIIPEPPTQSQDTAKKAEEARVRPDYQIIIARNLFQSTNEDIPIKDEDKAPRPETLAPTSLNLTLIGTISGSKDNARAVIIDNSSKKQDNYQTGDSILGARIKEIRRKEITLHVNNKDEILVFKEPDQSQAEPALPLNQTDTTQAPSPEQAEDETPPVEDPNL
jgi:type II secretory pathway component PulC